MSNEKTAIWIPIFSKKNNRKQEGSFSPVQMGSHQQSLTNCLNLSSPSAKTKSYYNTKETKTEARMFELRRLKGHRHLESYLWLWPNSCLAAEACWLRVFPRLFEQVQGKFRIFRI